MGLVDWLCQMQLVKLLVVGDQGAGKTTVLRCFFTEYGTQRVWVHGSTSPVTYDIIMGSNSSEHRKLRGCRQSGSVKQLQKFELQLVEIPHQLLLEDIPYIESVIESSHGILFVLDVSNPKSVSGLIKWRRRLNDLSPQFIEKPFVLLLHKTDLTNTVNRFQAHRFKKLKLCSSYKFTTQDKPRKIRNAIEHCVSKVTIPKTKYPIALESPPGSIMVGVQSELTDSDQDFVFICSDSEDDTLDSQFSTETIYTLQCEIVDYFSGRLMSLKLDSESDQFELERCEHDFQYFLTSCQNIASEEDLQSLQDKFQQVRES